ncbi:TPM domain-containing protein [Minwuia sp.]|uniref:TPM domain-containing protein n=1 Tax=Minwuia sp. TaxID=2493630 RepID=UPI003A94A017
MTEQTDRVFSDAEHQRVADAIRAVENETTGEIVTVVARACEPYSIIAGLWSVLAGLAAGVIAVPLWPEVPAVYLVAGQIGVSLIVAGLLQYMPLRMTLVPKAVRHRRAHRMARTQFLEQGLHRTEGRTGILIFAAMAEHYVEIIADEGINDRVDPGVWESVVSDFTADMKRGKVIDAFVGAVTACGDVLKIHAPKVPGNVSELPDRLIEI